MTMHFEEYLVDKEDGFGRCFKDDYEVSLKDELIRLSVRGIQPTSFAKAHGLFSGMSEKKSGMDDSARPAPGKKY